MQLPKLYCGLLVVTALTSPAHANGDVIDMAPTSKWVLDYDATSCKLVRSFGAGDRSIIAQFNGYSTANSFELRLLGEPLRMSRSRDVGLAFGNEAPARKVMADAGRIGKDALPLLFMGRQSLLPPSTSSGKGVDSEISPEQEAQIDSLTVTLPTGKAYRLKTGPMAEPMAAMQTCLDDLLRGWGLEPSELKSVVTSAQPIGSPARWFNYTDYPSEMLRNEVISNVAFVLVIGKLGEIENCYLQSVTSDPVFGEMVCAKLRQRAKFTPALNDAGQAVRSLYRNQVAWRIGG